MCEPEFDDSSQLDLYVLSGASKEVVWRTEGAGAINDRGVLSRRRRCPMRNENMVW